MPVMPIKFIFKLYRHNLLVLSLVLVSQVTEVWFYRAYLPAILMFSLQPANDTTALKIAT